MTVTLACIILAIGYAIGFCRGWMRGIEETRTYIDGRAWQVRPPAPAADDDIVRARGRGYD